MPTFTIPAHLLSECGNDDYCTACTAPVRQAPSGRWYITMGHAGFNSPANNRDGYTSQDAAVRSHRRYAGLGGVR